MQGTNQVERDFKATFTGEIKVLHDKGTAAFKKIFDTFITRQKLP